MKKFTQKYCESVKPQITDFRNEMTNTMNNKP